MAIIHSSAIATPVPNVLPQAMEAGQVNATLFQHKFIAAYTASGNILELGILPAFCSLVDYYIQPGGTWTGITCSAGVLTGALGADGSRTHNAELFAAATSLASGTVRGLAGGKNPLLLVPPVDYDRGIGITLSGDVSADGTGATFLALGITYIRA